MPNWAYCKLEIYGPKTDLEKIKTQTTATFTNYNGDEVPGFDLSKLYPMPEVLVGTRSPAVTTTEIPEKWPEFVANGTWTQDWYDEMVTNHIADYEKSQLAYKATGFYDWYDWSLSAYGAKWPPSDVDLLEDINPFKDDRFQMAFSFHSPWSPPVNLIEHIAHQFPDCGFVMAFTEESKAYTGAVGFVFNGDGIETFEVCFAIDQLDTTSELGQRYIAAQKKLAEIEYDFDSPLYEDLMLELDDIDMELADNASMSVQEDVFASMNIAV